MGREFADVAAVVAESGLLMETLFVEGALFEEFLKRTPVEQVLW